MGLVLHTNGPVWLMVKQAQWSLVSTEEASNWKRTLPLLTYLGIEWS
jgi:hypothetical protein